MSVCSTKVRENCGLNLFPKHNIRGGSDELQGSVLEKANIRHYYLSVEFPLVDNLKTVIYFTCNTDHLYGQTVLNKTPLFQG